MLPSVVLALALTQLDQRFVLTWEVPCAPAPDVSSLLGSAEGEAAVSITAVDAQWRLEVAFVSPTRATRELTAPTCEDAAKAALLLLKLGATAAPDRAPVVARPPQPVPETPPPPPAPPEPPAPPRTIEVRLDLGAIANAGALPSLSPRLAATLGLAWGSIAGFLGLRAGVPGAFAGGPAAARFSVHPALGAQLSGCFLGKWGRVRAGPCAVLGAEWWRVAGLEVDLPRRGSEAWLVTGLDGRLLVNLGGGLFAIAVAGARFSLRRPQLVFEGFGEAFVVPLLSGEGALGLGWRW